MASEDRFDITRLANGSNAREARQRSNSTWPYEEESRPSRESIIRNYNESAAARARSTRQHSQEAMQDFQRREELTLERQRQKSEYESNNPDMKVMSQVPQSAHMSQEQAKMHARELRARRWETGPITTQERRDRTLVSRENIEAERARRDVFSRNPSRTSNREVIDGRGSIDSRAFNERNELVGYSIDQRDRPDPLVEAPSEQGGRWNSQAGQDFSPTATRGTGFSRRQNDLNKLSDSISGRSNYRPKGPIASLPLSAKFLIVLIIILLGILIYLLFF